MALRPEARSLFRGGRSRQTKRQGRVSAGLLLSKKSTKEMTCQDLSTEGLSGSKRNGIPDRSTLHGVRVSVERFVETAQLSFERVLDVL